MLELRSFWGAYHRVGVGQANTRAPEVSDLAHPRRSEALSGVRHASGQAGEMNHWDWVLVGMDAGSGFGQGGFAIEVECCTN